MQALAGIITLMDELARDKADLNQRVRLMILNAHLYAVSASNIPTFLSANQLVR